MSNSDIQIGNVAYLEALYEAYMTNPDTVDSEIRHYFSSLEKGTMASFSQGNPKTTPLPSPSVKAGPLKGNSTGLTPVNQSAVHDSIRALMLIRNYRVRGHLHADLDPLKIEKRENHPELSPEFYGFLEADYDRPIFLDGVLGFENATLHQILERLKKTYSSTIGVEFMHIQDPERKAWVQETFESVPFALTPQQKKRVLENLLKAELFEKFLHVKFQGAKRFGLDGGESVIAGLEAIVENAAENRLKQVVIGMSHRGRLNVITNTIGKNYRTLFAKFFADKEDPHALGSGDVKYHLGFSNERDIHGHKIHLSLASNPSHLEAVDPVVLGKVRAEQFHLGDTDRKKIMGILLHGDAAFAGQGLVPETLCLSDLKGYRTGGTLHIIVNNQIGFTTSPPHSRSSPYSSDVAKGIQAPIFHVNGDDPESVVRVCRIAADYRRTFQHDVVIDIVCYRRYGHNESDEPSFTQPVMYKTIANHPSTATLYGERLLKEGALSQKDLDQLRDGIQNNMEDDYKRALAGDDCYDQPHWLKGAWKDIKAGPNDNLSILDTPLTGVKKITLSHLGEKLFQQPKDFNINPKILRQLQAKQKMMSDGEGIDWATAEALAFGSLLSEGHHVRLSGQDCGRGTFSQRHAVLVDQENEEKYVPLNHIHADQPPFEVIDSPLAEASVLGFEYGYAGANPQDLVLWEAQFGDFANGAQVIIDQFISAGEMKWLRQNGIVMLLPHSYEGQGPEHSSARLERFLQLCGDGNWFVANCSTPANYFHILRRQVKLPYRKPLILMTPKSLLRNKRCVSSLSDFTEGTSFKTVIADTRVNPKDVEKVIMCSGKVYYDLLQAAEETQENHVALIRVEQFYPWPHKELMEALAPYQSAQFVWCQEEPENMGAWSFVDRRLEQVLVDLKVKNNRPSVISRPVSASPATGLLKRHEVEQKQIVDEALSMTKNERKPLTALR